MELTSDELLERREAGRRPVETAISIANTTRTRRSNWNLFYRLWRAREAPKASFRANADLGRPTPVQPVPWKSMSNDLADLLHNLPKNLTN
jgi:hypothetical protein